MDEPKITHEQLEEFKIEYENRQARNIELSELEKKYRKWTVNNELSLELDWQDEISKIDKEFLFKTVTLEGFDKLEQNFTVEYLDLDKVLNFHCKGEDEALKLYPKNKLWTTAHRTDSKITRLIEYILDGKTLCPIVIGCQPNEYSNGEHVFSLHDGNHRAALCRYLKIKEIPFLIRREQVDKIQNAINSC